MFLQEKELKEAFWQSYNKKGRAPYYQFECPIREGNADLVTLEYYAANGMWQVNGFEFKLNDIKKAFLQAEGNLRYCNKSWIVIPIEKKDVILNRYMNYLKDKKYIGVIGVMTGGFYEIIYQPWFQKEPYQSQAIFDWILDKSKIGH